MELYTIFNKSYRNKRGLESSGNLKKSKSRSISKKKLLLATTTTTTTTSARTKTKIPKRPPTMPIILKDIKDTIIDNYDRFSMAINLGFVEKDTGCFYEPIQCGFCDETKKIASMTEEEAIFEKPCNIKYPSIYTIKTLKDHISKCHIDFYKKITNVRINIIQNC